MTKTKSKHADIEDSYTELHQGLHILNLALEGIRAIADNSQINPGDVEPLIELTGDLENTLIELCEAEKAFDVEHNSSDQQRALRPDLVRA
jgi:hypothetical protein